MRANTKHQQRAAPDGINARVDGVNARVAALPWGQLAADLDTRGYATAAGLLSLETCRSLITLYGSTRRFRSRVVMERHSYGSGEYQYFGYPLPRVVAELRRCFYAHLAPIANTWSRRLGQTDVYPERLRDFVGECHARGQSKATPLLLRYEREGYNCLHQDLYGDLAFPLQVTIALSRPGDDYRGGEFLLTEQRPRMQSRGEAITLRQGEAIVFANRYRPVAGKRGDYRVNARHGVSRIHSGQRFTLGIIFHDAA